VANEAKKYSHVNFLLNRIVFKPAAGLYKPGRGLYKLGRSLYKPAAGLKINP
jgi:hypothetical protein